MSPWNTEGWATLPPASYGPLEARLDRLWAILACRLALILIGAGLWAVRNW